MQLAGTVRGVGVPVQFTGAAPGRAPPVEQRWLDVEHDRAARDTPVVAQHHTVADAQRQGRTHGEPDRVGADRTDAALHRCRTHMQQQLASHALRCSGARVFLGWA